MGHFEQWLKIQSDDLGCYEGPRNEDEKHTNIPKSFIYNYSFALLPESCHPSGSLNMSRIDNVDLTLSLQPELSKEETALYVIAIA